MIATVTYVVKNFACGGLFSILYFNFVHDSIHYFCADCGKFCRKISPAAGFFLYFISISFTIPLIICVQTATNYVMEFRLRRASGTLIFQFRQFLISPKFIPAYATARDCTKCIQNPQGGCKYVLHPPLGG